MAAPRTSRGFTLVELLVVITIIGMLVSLLLPAIQSAREAGRRTTCLNNMRQAAIGLMTVEETRKAFPGYANLMPKTSGNVLASWVVPILPALEQNALYQNWANPGLDVQWNSATPATYNRPQYITQLGILVCPSNANPDLNDDALSWVVNTGIALTASDNSPSMPNLWAEDSASGVMFNQAVSGGKKVNMDYITSNDGSTNTLLLSENLQSGGWATDPVSGMNTPFQSDFAVRQCTGMVWFLTGNQDNNTLVTPLPLAANFIPDAMGVNDLAQQASGLPTMPFSATNYSQPSGLAYARPSSYHPGGVNSMFCGGNSRFLNEAIDYKVFTQLMTSHQKQVVVDTENNVPIRANSTVSGGTIQGPVASPGSNQVPIPWGYILNEAEL